MSDGRSDALVFCGATGDLAYKKIFPALHAMVKRGHLDDVPVIGVAKAGRGVDELRAPVLQDPSPVYEYEPGCWGLKEADAKVSPPGG
jgi:glucose-6-phosphate 1-dehydrogenase